MKFILVIFLVINPLTDLDKIAKINKAKKEAERAYLAEDYGLANAKYLYLKDSLGVTDDKLMLNLANTQFILEDSANAINSYSELKNSPNKEVSSIAHQQLGAMQFNNKKYEEALSHYKSALKENPGNADARYNYELLKKLLKEQEEEQEQNKDQQNKDQKDQQEQEKEQQQQEQNKEDQEKQDQEEQQDQEKRDQEDQEEKQEKKEQEEQNPDEQKNEEDQESKPNPIDEEKLKEMKISEEKAKLILEAMKNNEVQYIQQNKRKAKKKKDPSKPDW
jgi:hypothetical protein